MKARARTRFQDRSPWSRAPGPFAARAGLSGWEGVEWDKPRLGRGRGAGAGFISISNSHFHLHFA